MSLVAYTPHTLFEFGGALPEATGVPEQWNCGLRGWSHNDQAPIPAADLDEYLAALVVLLKTWFNTAANGMASNATLNYAKLNNINALGHYAEAGVTHRLDISPATVGGAAPTSVNFTSLCYTWETGLLRGRAHRGRMYPPNFTWNFSGAKVGSSSAENNALAGVALIHDVCQGIRSASFEDEFEAHIFSKLDGSHHPITGVSSDDVYDVQRRRKNQVTVTRSPVNAIPSTP